MDKMANTNTKVAANINPKNTDARKDKLYLL